MLPSLKEQSKHFSEISTTRSIFELFVSVGGYLITIGLVYVAWIHELYFIYIGLCVLGGLFAVKNFSLFHDCTHGSMFASEKTNLYVGRFLSLLVSMPFAAWKFEHDSHHSHVSNIEEIDYGDIPTFTVENYKSESKLMQIGYRIFRQPWFLLLVSPFAYFFIKARIPNIYLLQSKDVIKSVIYTDIALAMIYVPLMYLIGIWTTFFIFVPALYIAGIIGIGLFYLQHDYPEASWFTSEHWEHEKASLHGSSLLILPQPLDWFSHSIGYHHIHHVNSSIPGYKLSECYKNIKAFNDKKPLTWADICTAFSLRLWSHSENRLVTLKESKFLDI